MSYSNKQFASEKNSTEHPIQTNPSKRSKPFAGILMVLASLVMVFYGIGFSGSYLGSISYYHAVRVFYPALVIGLWNFCVFPFPLAGGIFLLKGKHFLLSIVGVALTLTSAFVPMIVLTVFPNYVWTNGLLIGLPFLCLSLLSLVNVVRKA